MFVIRIINIIFYAFVLCFLCDQFIGTNFFTQIGGAEIAFIIMMVVIFLWIGFIVYGLIRSKLWGYNHAIWFNSIIILVLSIKVFLSQNTERDVIASHDVGGSVSLMLIIFTLVAVCFSYFRNIKTYQKGKGA